MICNSYVKLPEGKCQVNLLGKWKVFFYDKYYISVQGVTLLLSNMKKNVGVE